MSTWPNWAATWRIVFFFWVSWTWISYYSSTWMSPSAATTYNLGSMNMIWVRLPSSAPTWLDSILEWRLQVAESAIVVWWAVSFLYFAPRMGNKLTNCLMEWVALSSTLGEVDTSYSLQAKTLGWWQFPISLDGSICINSTTKYLVTYSILNNPLYDKKSSLNFTQKNISIILIMSFIFINIKYIW